MKTHILAVFITFVAVWLTDFLIHGVWLSSAYKATAHLWRPEAEMVAKMPWMLAGQFIVALGIATLYVKAMADRATIRCASASSPPVRSSSCTPSPLIRSIWC